MLSLHWKVYKKVGAVSAFLDQKKPLSPNTGTAGADLDRDVAYQHNVA